MRPLAPVFLLERHHSEYQMLLFLATEKHFLMTCDPLVFCHLYQFLPSWPLWLASHCLAYCCVVTSQSAQGMYFKTPTWLHLKGLLTQLGCLEVRGKSHSTCTVVLTKSPCRNKTFHEYESIAVAEWNGGLVFFFPRWPIVKRFAICEQLYWKNLWSCLDKTKWFFKHSFKVFVNALL